MGIVLDELILENEIEYVGHMLKDNDIFVEGLEFCEPYTNNIYKAMEYLLASEVKPSSTNIISHINKQGLDTVAHRNHLKTCSEAAYNKHRLELVKDNHARFKATRDAYDVMHNTMTMINTPLAHEVDINDTIKDLEQLNNRGGKTEETMKETMSNYLEMKLNLPAEGISGAPTGYNLLDKMLDGWQDSDLYILAARPSMG